MEFKSWEVFYKEKKKKLYLFHLPILVLVFHSFYINLLY